MINVLITGSGAPGTLGTIQMLEQNPDNEPVRIVATDMRPDVIGKYHADKFYRIPPWDDMAYVNQLFKICKKEKIDLIIPQNTMELHKLASYRWRDMNFMLDDANKIFVANNKWSMIVTAQKTDVPWPSTIKYTSDPERSESERLIRFMTFVKRVGYDPETPIVVKPAVGHGSRGVKVLHGHIDYTERWKMKPNTTHMSMEDFINWFEYIPRTDILIQEYLPGDEYTIDVMITEEEAVAVPRRRERISSGITSLGSVVKYNELIEYCIKLSERLGLKYPHGYQFKEDNEGTPKLLECNPRVQGTMVATYYAGWNIVWDGVRRALGQEVDLTKVKSNLNWNTRVLRYTDTIKL